MEKDIRWEQRFSNFVKALEKLKQSIDYINQNNMHENEVAANNNDSDTVLMEMMKEGLIQRFEYTHELAWKTMKDYAEYQGNTNIGGSRDAVREAFQMKIVTDG